MKHSSFLIGFILIIVFLQAQAQSEVLDAKAYDALLISTKEKIILDVRTQEEYNEGHIPNAILIDYYRSDFKKQLSKLDKNVPVFVYCKAGGRSASAVEQLTGLGFKQVYDLQNGITAWKNAGKIISKK